MIDLKYLGRSMMSIPAVGFSAYALGYRTSTNTWLTVGQNSYPQLGFLLFEMSMPAIGQPMQLVKSWGPINPQPADPLHTKKANGVYNSLVEFGTILPDESIGGFWGCWASEYATPETTPHFFAAFRFVYDPVAGDHIEIAGGPWTCPVAMIGRTRNGVQLAPPEIKAATGFDFISIGAHTSGYSAKSWGPGLVGFNKPDLSLPAGTELEVSTILHWPMKYDASTNPPYYYSDCPKLSGLPNAVWCEGNSDCNPPTKLSYQNNVFHNVDTFSVNDGILGMICVRGVILYCVRTAYGYSWYGNQKSHADDSPIGVQFENNLDSLINPGHLTVGATTPRGYHFEAITWSVASIPLQAAVNPIQTQVPWESSALMNTLGGDVPIPVAGDFDQFVQVGDVLYLLHVGGPNPSIYAWQLPPEEDPIMIEELQAQVLALQSQLTDAQNQLTATQNQLMVAANQIVDLSTSVTLLGAELNSKDGQIAAMIQQKADGDARDQAIAALAAQNVEQDQPTTP